MFVSYNEWLMSKVSNEKLKEVLHKLEWVSCSLWELGSIQHLGRPHSIDKEKDDFLFKPYHSVAIVIELLCTHAVQV